jgi:UDP-N-acetylglucosamine acyltransferase
MIHPTAIVHPRAKIHSSVRVGPYAVIDESVELGADCVVGPYVYLTGITSIGVGNRFHAGCVIGDAPQDLKYQNEPTRLRIGDGNVFREHVTVNRSNKPEEDTVIGSRGFFMEHCHVAHNCLVGDHVILANGALLAGHVTIQDRAFISGNCAVHQFVRVGTLALTQGGSVATQDLPPFTVMQGVNLLTGLNTIGLRRAGFSPEERLELKQVYRALFRSGVNLRAAVAKAKERFTSAPSKVLLDFISETKRGVCSDPSRRAAASGQDPSDV